jgi:outer membrane murein-binding lipoprotein Lpp
MKKIIFAVLICTVILSSCSKDETSYNEQSIDVNSLPAAITQYVDNYYPDASIAEASVITTDETSYLICLNTNEKLAFNKSGSYLGNSSAILSGHHGHGGHHGNGHGGGHHGHGNHANDISVDSLSIDILNYISANYSGYSAMHAEIDTMCQFGNVTEVMIGISGSSPVKLVFDTANVFVLKAERIAVSSIPQAVIDAITNTYTAFTMKPMAEKFTLADSSVEYNLFIRQSLVRKQITIKSDATIVCEK